jgi:hypothetical protein
MSNLLPRPAHPSQPQTVIPRTRKRTSAIAIPAIVTDSKTAIDSLQSTILTLEDELNHQIELLQPLLIEYHNQEYPIEAIQHAVVKWLERTIEELVQETTFHCVTGSSTVAVNRLHFIRALNHKHSESRTD